MPEGLPSLVYILRTKTSCLLEGPTEPSSHHRVSHLTADLRVIRILPKKAPVSCREQSHSQWPAHWVASVPSSIETDALRGVGPL